MARDVDSLALCMQALLCDYMFTLDPTVPPIPFNTQVSPREGEQNQGLEVKTARCIQFNISNLTKATGLKQQSYP